MTTPNQLMLQGLERFMNLGLIEEAVAHEYIPSHTKVVTDLRKQLATIRQMYREDNNFTEEQMKALRFAMAAMKEALAKRGSYDD